MDELDAADREEARDKDGEESQLRDTLANCLNVLTTCYGRTTAIPYKELETLHTHKPVTGHCTIINVGGQITYSLIVNH